MDQGTYRYMVAAHCENAKLHLDNPISRTASDGDALSSLLNALSQIVQAIGILRVAGRTKISSDQ